ncbi:MAG: AI-2E family transporter [Burkholderiales bacterium]|jgi:predicted PurR-regulated permease PerM|nr:AI-2E family transporter [Burkholderiales bacterium]
MQFSSTQKRTAAWAAIALLICFVLWLLTPVLTPFVVAAVLAYALTPLVDSLCSAGRLRLPRVLAVLLVELAFIIVLLGIVLLMVPILAKELPQLREQIPVLLDGFNAWLKPFLAQFGIKISLDLPSIKGFVLKYLSANAEDTLSSVLNSLRLGGSVAFAIFSNAVLVPVALFYLLMDWHRLVERTLEWVPPRARLAYDSFTNEADTVLGQYLRGQLLVMLVLAVYYSAGLALFGLDLALPIGIFTGLAVFVPYVGFGLGLILATLAGLLEFAATAGVAKALLMVGVVYGLGQLIEGFFLTPRLVGERIGLHPLAVIFALLAFGQLLGFVGVLIALPSSAVLLVALRRAQAHYRASKLYLG